MKDYARTPTQKNAYYRSKAKESFKTKLNIYLFSLVINQQESFSNERFIAFKLEEPIIKKYVAEYWQMEEDKKINRLNYKDIALNINQLKTEFASQIKASEAEYINNFESIFKKSDFEKIIDIEICAYCDITIDTITELGSSQKLIKKNLRGWNLEIDRMNPNLEYTNDNCVMACYWCNNAKTDEFSYKEFKMIGQSIKEVWESRKNDSR